MYSCTLQCNHATTITQQSAADIQQSTNPPAVPPPTQPVVYADIQHSTNPPAAPEPIVFTETKTTGQVSAMFKYVLSNDVPSAYLCHVLSMWGVTSHEIVFVMQIRCISCELCL